MKSISLMLSIFTVFICGWLVVSQLNYLDIPINKNDSYASWEKQKIGERADVSACDKKLLINTIDLGRKNERYLSGIAFQTQVTALAIIIVQLGLISSVLLTSKKPK